MECVMLQNSNNDFGVKEMASRRNNLMYVPQGLL